MTKKEYVTIREAARRYGVSDKKLQRAIRAEKLAAHYPKPNRCEIAVSDLERFLQGHLSGQTTEPLEQRVVELEQRVQQLEHLVEVVLSEQGGPRRKRMGKTRERTTGPLPKSFVSLPTFARLHNVAESRVETHADRGLLPVKRGDWTDADGTMVTVALDAKGRSAFHQLYHDVPPFIACKQCPH
jgi:hypothetical protein